MKTLNKKHTTQFFTTPDGYDTLKKRWSALANDPTVKLSASDHLWYLILRGKNYHKAFLPGHKMEYYNIPQGLWDAINGNIYNNLQLFDNKFGDILVNNWRVILKQIIPSCFTANHYESEPYITDKVEELFGKAEPKISKSSVSNIMEIYAEANA